MINEIQTLWQQINTFQTASSDDARRGRLLNILLAGTLLFAIVILILVLTVFTINSSWDKPGNNLLLLTLVVTIAAAIGLFIVNQRSVAWASFLFLVVLILASTFSDSPQELANGRSSFIFFIPIAISSLLLRPISSFFFAFLTSTIVFVLSSIADTSLNVPIIAGLFFLALVSWLSSRSLEQALQDLREINVNLDGLVTERTQALSDALGREQIESGRSQAILNSIADGVIVFDANNSAILANPALSRLIERSQQDLVGRKFDDFIRAEQISAANRESLMKLIQQREQTTSGMRIEWGRKTLSTSMASVRDTVGENIGTVAVFRDISREAEVEKLKEAFVAMVSHELRTPLNAIMGHAEMLKEAVYGVLNDQQTSIAGRIMANSERLLGMVGDLLDEAQISAGKLSIRPQVFKTGSLLDALHNTMDKITNDKGLYLKSEIASNMPVEIKGDPQRLQQVLINLVNNAVKFTEKGGIHVRILPAQPKHWAMEITDTGIGIPEGEIANIFEAFRQIDPVTTRQRGGFGLGLSIVKQLVELMKGEIKVQSKPGSGSTFTVTLPFEINS